MGGALLFASAEHPERPHLPSSPSVSETHDGISGNNGEGSASPGSRRSPWAAAATAHPDGAELSNDQDHDGKPDGVADPLAVLALGFMATLGMGLVFSPVVGGRFVSARSEPPRLSSSLWPQVLERPG
jgi:hypothetical protein